MPHPEGPMMATNSPSLISNETPLRAVVSISSVLKILLRFDTLIIIVFFLFVSLLFFGGVKGDKEVKEDKDNSCIVVSFFGS